MGRIGGFGEVGEWGLSCLLCFVCHRSCLDLCFGSGELCSVIGRRT